MTTSIACIPVWRADETLYSWAAGFHRTYGNGSARDTGALLFGTEHACRERDAPTNLRHFVNATNGELGDVGSILLSRTSIGLFAPFMPASRRKILSDRIGADDGPGWRILCGMPASSLEDTTALHYCEACVSNDLRNWGIPRWRLPHQLTGAWICLEHGLLLRTLRTNVSQWLLPPVESTGIGAPELNQPLVDSLRRMTGLSRRLVGAEPLDIESVRQAVLHGLRDHGVTSWTTPLDKLQLASWLAKSPIATWMQSRNGPWTRLATGHWIHDLLRNRTGNHPLKWMLIWCILFADENEETSLRRFMNTGSEPHWDAHGQGTIWGTSSESIPLDIQQIITEAVTLEEAASSLGLTVCSLRRRLQKLGTTPREFRLDTSFDRRKRRALDAIGNYIAAHPACSRSDIYLNCKAATAWIRANDPELIAVAVRPINDQSSNQIPLQLMPDSEAS